MRLFECLVAGCLLLPGLSAQAEQNFAPPRSAGGSLVLIGGSLSEDIRILSEIVRLADAADPHDAAPTIAIVTAAARTASSPEETTDAFNTTVGNGVYYGNLFGSLGAQTYAVPVDVADDFPQDPYVPANAYDASVAAAVAQADGVFFGGGDQTDYLRSLYACAAAPDEAFTSCQDTPVMAAIRTVYQNGGVIAGTSAGDTIQQGGFMVTGGESYEAWLDGAEAGYFSDPRQLAYIPYGGNGFFAHGYLDSHFTTWGRQGRMIRMAVDLDRRPVFGIDETTALVVERRADGRELATVVGDHGVSILETAWAVNLGDTVTGTRWTYLTDGDQYDFATKSAIRATGSQNVVRTGRAQNQQNVFSSIDGPAEDLYKMRDMARDFVTSRSRRVRGLTYERRPRFKVFLERDGATEAWQTPAGNVSFSDVMVRIQPR